MKNILTELLFKLHDYTSNLKYQQGKKMLENGALSSLHIEAEEDVPVVIPLNFLHPHTAYIYYNYACLPHSIYRHKAKQEAEVVAKPKRGSPPKTMNTISNNSDKVATKQNKQEVTCKQQRHQ